MSRVNFFSGSDNYNDLPVGGVFYFPKESNDSILNSSRYVKLDRELSYSKTTYDSLYNKIPNSIPKITNGVATNMNPRATYNLVLHDIAANSNFFFVARGEINDKNGIAYPLERSTNGINWTNVTVGATDGWPNKQVFALSNNSVILQRSGVGQHFSTDGITWSTITGLSNTVASFAYWKNKYWSPTKESTNGIIWTTNSSISATGLYYNTNDLLLSWSTSIGTNNGGTSTTGTVLSVTTDGINWVSNTYSIGSTQTTFERAVAAFNNKFYIATRSNIKKSILSSTNGINWTEVYAENKLSSGITPGANNSARVSYMQVYDNKLYYLTKEVIGYDLLCSEDGENFYKILNEEDPFAESYSNTNSFGFAIRNNRIAFAQDNGGDAYVFSADLYSYSTTSEFWIPYSSDLNYHTNVYARY